MAESSKAPDGPQVYRSSNIERLDAYWERYAKAGAKEHTRMAMEYARAMHDAMVDLLQRQEAMADDVKAMRKDMAELLKRSGGQA